MKSMILSELVTFVAFLMPCCASEAMTCEPSRTLLLEKKAETASAFFGPEINVKKIIKEDINKDGLEDLVLVGQEKESSDGTGFPARILLVAIRHRSIYRLISATDRLLLCAGCGGAAESSDVSVKAGRILVEQISGSSSKSIMSDMFAYVPGKKDIFLLEKKITNVSEDGRSKSVRSDYIQGDEETTMTRFDEASGKDVVERKSSRTIPRSATPLSSICEP